MSDKPKKMRYPLGLFLMGLFTNFIGRNLLLFAVGVVLMVIGIWNEWCFRAGLSLLIMDFFMSLIQQLRFRRIALTSTDPKLKGLQDAILSGDWKAGMKAWADRENIYKDN